MQLTGEELIPQPRDKVWEGLNDPQVLKACISGCEEIANVAENEYKVVLLAAVGPVKARFNGKLFLSDINPLESYALAFEGVGGAAGFAKGRAQVQLAPSEGGTLLVYSADAQIGGKIAQVGSRLIEGVARKITAEFFAKFNEIVSTPAESEPIVELAATEAEVPAQAAEASTGQSGRFRAALRRFVGAGDGQS